MSKPVFGAWLSEPISCRICGIPVRFVFSRALFACCTTFCKKPQLSLRICEEYLVHDAKALAVLKISNLCNQDPM